MKKIIIYTTTYCPYCVKAKALLTRKGLAFEEIDVTGKDEERLALQEKSGGKKTVPQIFIGDVHIGGCDDLYAKDETGALEELLA